MAGDDVANKTTYCMCWTMGGAGSRQALRVTRGGKEGVCTDRLPRKVDSQCLIKINL